MRTGTSPNTRYIPPSPARGTPRPSNPAIVGESAWASEATKWIGAPYRLGGNTRRGMDCSGLVLTMYQNVARVDLPRTAFEQSRTGFAIPREQVRPGDILFFETTPRAGINHAGIYLGQGRFVHASTHQGVIYTQLTDPFYAQCYRTARRILR